MSESNPQVYYVIVIGSIIALFIVGIIVIMVYLNQRKVYKLNDSHEKELLRIIQEIQNDTLQNISSELHDNFGHILSIIKLNLATIAPQVSKNIQIDKLNIKKY